MDGLEGKDAEERDIVVEMGGNRLFTRMEACEGKWEGQSRLMLRR